ncbi:hypothetical protein KCP70_16870 [Salmonella enterica subsp. enterica]|nr:hypothetical protein KCP70_16870 [Salmonella enterica subsp. enterica]
MSSARKPFHSAFLFGNGNNLLQLTITSRTVFSDAGSSRCVFRRNFALCSAVR